MIRAKLRSTNQFVYIYQTYLQTNYDNEVVWHYLCSENIGYGLKVYYSEEIDDIEVLKYFHDENIDLSEEYMHPILKKIVDSDWELYSDIVEGDQESWLIFEQQLGHRP
ncbi:hypothetical protein [Psychrobacter sp. FME61]|uniref:hypothetical protein n=1 Tax=unclassified Psychrobacter TaxID=196806 RepID=UPI0018668F6E|nr:hypothetical protein [Psychrobacter sp. FME61]